MRSMPRRSRRRRARRSSRRTWRSARRTSCSLPRSASSRARSSATETNPYRIAQKLFAAVDRIPWAGAREYSTISNISDYALHAGHGDCGQQTLLLMTLLRLNGIPTRWQSGWVYSDGELRQHARLGAALSRALRLGADGRDLRPPDLRRSADRLLSISAGSTPTASHSTTTTASLSCRPSSTSAPTPSIHNGAKSNGAAATSTSISGITNSKRRS